MKQSKLIILTILFTIFSINLSAEKTNTITTVQCINTTLQLSVYTTKLNATEDAIVDNTGGYVDIPEERYYLKSKLKVSKIKGRVLKDSKNNRNIFHAAINKKDLNILQKYQNLQLIQKIDLLENNQLPLQQSITTTNSVKLHFNKNDQDELKRCKN